MRTRCRQHCCSAFRWACSPRRLRRRRPGRSPRPRGRVDSLFPEVGHPGYDALHYAVALRYRPATKAIVATTSVRAKAKKRLAAFSLDFEGDRLTVQRVRVNGRTATFSRAGNKLVIRPARAVRGSSTAKIDYSGVPTTHIDPDGSKDGWIQTSDGATALNEPVGAMTWFPNNNTPRDKATFTPSRSPRRPHWRWRPTDR